MSAVLLSLADSLLNEWAGHQAVALLFMAICIIVAWRWLFLSRIRIVQREAQQNAQIAADVARARMQLVVRQSNYRDKGVA